MHPQFLTHNIKKKHIYKFNIYIILKKRKLTTVKVEVLEQDEMNCFSRKATSV